MLSKSNGIKNPTGTLKFLSIDWIWKVAQKRAKNLKNLSKMYFIAIPSKIAPAPKIKFFKNGETETPKTSSISSKLTRNFNVS